jgi:hypothetical protein
MGQVMGKDTSLEDICDELNLILRGESEDRPSLDGDQDGDQDGDHEGGLGWDDDVWAHLTRAKTLWRWIGLIRDRRGGPEKQTAMGGTPTIVLIEGVCVGADLNVARQKFVRDRSPSHAHTQPKASRSLHQYAITSNAPLVS